MRCASLILNDRRTKDAGNTEELLVYHLHHHHRGSRPRHRLPLQKYKQADARQKAVELGVQALLRDRIVQSYYHYEERGWITLHGLENVNAMYKEYHALGGNGTVTSLVNSIRELDVRDDKRPASQE